MNTLNTIGKTSIMSGFMFRFRTENSILIVSFAISIFLHLLIISFFSQRILFHKKTADRVIQVELAASSSRARAAAVIKTAKVRKQVRLFKKRRAAAALPEKQGLKGTQTHFNNNTENRPTVKQKKKKNINPPDFLNNLGAAVLRNMSIPFLTRLLIAGEQEVDIELTIKPQGKLGTMRFLRKSSSDRINQSIKKAVNKIFPIDIGKYSGEFPIIVQIPIIIRK